MRNGRDTADHVGSDRLPHPRHLFAVDRAPLVAVASGGLLRRGATAASANRRNHILAEDAARRTGASDPSQIDTQFAGQPPNGRTCRLGSSLMTAASISTTVRIDCRSGLCNGHGLRGGLWRRRCRHRGRGSRLLCGRGRRLRDGSHRRCRGSRGCRPGRLQRQQLLTDRNRVALLDQHLLDDPARRAGHLDHRLIGFDLEHSLTRFDRITRGYQNRNDVSRVDVFTQVGQCECCRHAYSQGGQNVAEMRLKPLGRAATDG